MSKSPPPNRQLISNDWPLVGHWFIFDDDSEPPSWMRRRCSAAPSRSIPCSLIASSNWAEKTDSATVLVQTTPTNRPADNGLWSDTLAGDYHRNGTSDPLNHAQWVFLDAVVAADWVGSLMGPFRGLPSHGTTLLVALGHIEGIHARPFRHRPYKRGLEFLDSNSNPSPTDKISNSYKSNSQI